MCWDCLNPYMQSLPSYVKDTTDFINKIKDLNLSKDSYLVSLDVASLYTNIPHNERILSCMYYLDKDRGNNHFYTQNICKLLRIVLENNCFDFNGETFLQTTGTAMGSPMAPSYASLFMGKFKEDFINSISPKPDVWLRFLDDIVMVWNGSFENLNCFLDSINNFHSSIKFTCTYNISKTTVSFLDVSIYKDEYGQICSDIYCKPTNMHLYLDFSSSHPLSCKRGIPFSQAKRYRRIISNSNKFQQSLDSLMKYFIDRNYPQSLIRNAFSKALTLSREDVLSSKHHTHTPVIPFTV